MDKNKKVYYRMSAVGGVDKKTTYLHVFTARPDESEENKAIVEKSLLEMGRKNVYFPSPGDSTYVNRVIELSVIMKVVISGIFDGEFDLSDSEYSIYDVRGSL
jgi:hypothetical protein